MNCVLNESSLHGQYSNFDDFISSGGKNLSDILCELRELDFCILYKKSELYTAQVAPGLNFYQVFSDKSKRNSDELKRIKSVLASLQNNPFWDSKPMQNTSCLYSLVNDSKVDVTGTGIAEAYERNACLVSFSPSCYCFSPVIVEKDAADEKMIENVWRLEQFVDNVFNKGLMTPDEYFAARYSTRFNFSRIKKNYGFNLVDNANVGLFNAAFKKFEKLTWSQIKEDNGLDYKEFTKNKNTKGFFSNDEWSKGVKKFRVNDKIRCFGYVENNVFYLLRIDLDHKLSDLG